MVRSASFALLALASGSCVLACGPPESHPNVPAVACDMRLLGACIISTTSVRYDPSEIERQIRGALAYWNAPEMTLEAYTVVYQPEEITTCGFPDASGCTWWDYHVIEIEALDPACPETAQLVHEIGHVLHHDPGHRGPWWSWKDEQDATFDLVRELGATPACAASRYYTVRP